MNMQALWLMVKQLDIIVFVFMLLKYVAAVIIDNEPIILNYSLSRFILNILLEN